MTVTCFWLEPTQTVEVGLRRYRSSSDDGAPCPLPHGYHNATNILGQAGLTWYATRDDIPAGRGAHYFTMPGGGFGVPDFPYPPHTDPCWPAHCGCGYEFSPGDRWQEWSAALYRRADTGELTTTRAAPAGAMWDAFWYPWKGPDGRSLVVKCPGGAEWMIDGRATNCTLPEDTEHRCWIRHGEPPALTVDKDGLTCAAGAGSIQAGDYHGFLRSGVFEP